MTRAHRIPRTAAGIFLVFAIVVRTSAQTPTYGEFLDRALEVLGGDVTTLAYSGEGWDACLGQAWAVSDGWARWELTDYRRVIDYQTGTSVQNAMRRAGLDPDRVGGCGAQVDATASPQQSAIRADAPFADKLPIWLTPHGFLKLAGSGEPAVEPSDEGWSVAVPVTSGGVTHRVVADYSAEYLPLRIGTWIDDPIFGDMSVTAEFSAWRYFDGLRFPSGISLAQGGLETLVLSIDSVTAGVASPEIGPARTFGVGGGGDGPSPIEIGDGILVMTGAYQGVAVEFDDYVVVIDGMQSDTRTREIIRLTHEAIPGKPIRYAVNTHSHFDHASGLRQYAAEGATILTHELNAFFFAAALANARTLNPDPTEPSRVEADVQGIKERFVLTDASGQRLEIVPLEPSPHAADMLIVWLPTIATVVESDLLQPWINPIFAGDGDGPHPYLVYLADELERNDLDVEQFVPIHTPPEPPTMPRSALDEAVGR
jgi:glyoxylase-like metal-dependent hydrolase (beta-lactamase superfamily II)